MENEKWKIDNVEDFVTKESDDKDNSGMAFGHKRDREEGDSTEEHWPRHLKLIS